MDTPNNNYEGFEHKPKISNSNTQETPLNSKTPTSEDTLNYAVLRQIAIFKYGSVLNFARSLGWGKCWGSRLLSGSHIPRTAKTIKKIAEALAVDSVTLTQFFDRQLYSNKGEEKEK